MKNKITTILLSILALMFIAASCDESVQPGAEYSFPMQKGTSWDYDVYSIGEDNKATDEVISTRTITLGTMESLDDREAYPLLNSNPPSGEIEFFTHISKDEEGIYMYIGELDLNNFTDLPNTDTKIPILLLGWIKVFDFESNSWEAFFLDYSGVIGGDTVAAKIVINGFNEGLNFVNYQGSDYDASQIRLSLEVDATIKSTSQSTNESGSSNIQFEFIDGIGIYSLQQNINEVVGIDTGYKEVLTGHKY